MYQARLRRRRQRTIMAVSAGLVVAVVAAGVSYLLLRPRTIGSPQQTATGYLNAWQRGSYPAMQRLSVNVPRPGLAVPLQRADSQLGARRWRLSLGQVTSAGASAQARFRAVVDLASGHTWTYQGRLRLVTRDNRWWVSWSPAAIYPALGPGERFALSAVWPARAPVLASDGTVLSSAEAVAQSGSIALLTGIVTRASAAQARALGAPYQAGDLIGLGGIEQAYEQRLAGRPSLTIKIEGPGNQAGATTARFAASPGQPVRTSIDLRYQRAASRAVASSGTSKPVDLVAIQPSTGRVLAVVERPGGFDRALEGVFPPGSTFKVVTASALAERGMRPDSPVQCPSQVTIDGRTFHNDNNEHLGATILQTAFAVSCNSTFALLATQHLTGTALGATAASFGFNATPALGIPATLGRFSVPRTSVDLAADAFGQGTDLVNPLSQATVAGAVEAGAWRPPLLVVSPAPRQTAQPHPLPATVLDTLRPMMRAVVTSGTAAGVGFPPGVYGKTGTAEYGSGPNPPAHGWFIGYQGDLAFAVLVEGGGLGAGSAGPIASAFLRGL
ncbi:MAG TPA: penicillin-binding transpeptidase domain-containing protein [Streptosporangiaceae bacterium]|nr:penicillin-binding transpeptidase domain-containing protein [Streptosporangiaceae bacterium]